MATVEAKCITHCGYGSGHIYHPGQTYIIDTASFFARAGCFDIPKSAVDTSAVTIAEEKPEAPAPETKATPKTAPADFESEVKKKTCPCGKDFIPKSNRQKFCPECGEENEKVHNRDRQARYRERHKGLEK